MLFPIVCIALPVFSACASSSPEEFDLKGPEPYFPDDDDDASGSDDGSDDDDDDGDDDGDDDDDAPVTPPQAGTLACIDRDGDGRGEGCDAGLDCNDGDPWLWYRGFAYRDADYDGYPGTRVEACLGAWLPEGWGWFSVECNDADARINPGMYDFPDDGIDNDCALGDASTTDMDAIYVDGAAGDDAAPGTADSPKKTIGAGIAAATGGGAEAVIVARGEYMENVVTDVSLFGGYRAGDWTRDIDAFVSYIVPATTSATVEISGADGPIAVHGFRIDGPDNPDESRAISVSSAFGVWIGRNTVRMNESHTSYGVYSSETNATIIENSVELSEGSMIAAIRVACASSGSPESVVVANDVWGSAGAGAWSVAGIEAECAPRVVANRVAIEAADCDELTAILSIAPPDDVNFRWIATNEVEITGSNMEAYGIGQLTLGKTVENRVFAEVSGDSYVGGITGTIGAIISRNRIELLADTGETSAFLGISGWNFLAAVNNEVVLGGDWIAEGIRLYGFDEYGWGDGSAFGVILNNTIVTSGPSDSASAVFVTTMFEAFPTFSTLAELSISNNVLSSPSDRLGLIEIDAVEIFMWVKANNVLRGTAHCWIHTGACVDELSELNACDWEGCRSAGMNVSVDPLWADPEHGDYHLLPSSPMIDASLPFTPFSPLADLGLRDAEWNSYPTDIDGEPRPVGNGIDIGADEYAP